MSFCGQFAWNLLKVIFFPITLTYMFFEAIGAKKNKEVPTITLKEFASPYPVQMRKGKFQTKISEVAGRHPMEALASKNSHKVAVVIDTERESKALIPLLELSQLVERGIKPVEQKGHIFYYGNFPFTTKNLDGFAKPNTSFRGDIILAKSDSYPETKGTTILNSSILQGFSEKQINSLKESLRGQLYSAYDREAEVLILEHFGSQLGTPREVIRNAYEVLLREEFQGCFKEVIFVNRADDNASRPRAPVKTSREAMQINKLKP